MAEEKLPEDYKKELLGAYERFENNVIGEGVHEKYHHMIKDLKKRVK